MKEIRRIIENSIATKQALLENEDMLRTLDEVVGVVKRALENRGKVLFCGNGGSAADAQHMASELSGRFYLDREPLFGEALHVNTSHLTAVANDYGYDEVFAREVKAKGRKGDVLFCISTSGNSPNVLRAAEAAARLGITTIGMTGQSGGKLKDRCDYLLRVPSQDTPRIQESHILLGHIICELVEKGIFGNP